MADLGIFGIYPGAVEVVRRADPVVVAGALVLAQQVPLDAAEDVNQNLLLSFLERLE